MTTITRFNIRVYGLLFNSSNDVLLVHERIGNFAFTKFPGGGLELGEGIADCLIREFREETGIEVELVRHLYTTDFFQQSAFRETDQLISVYYEVRALSGLENLRFDEHEILTGGRKETLKFEWVSLDILNEEKLTFPIDKKLVREIIKKPL